MCIMLKIWHKYGEEIVWKSISNIIKEEKSVENFAKSEKQNRNGENNSIIFR